MEVSGMPLSSESEEPSTDYVSQGSFEEEDMLLASPIREAVAEAELTSSGATEEVTVEVSDTAAGRKRRGATYPTSALSEKGTKRPPSLGTTFVQAERDNLLGVVLVQDHPYTVLTKAQLDYVRAELILLLKETKCTSTLTIRTY